MQELLPATLTTFYDIADLKSRDLPYRGPSYTTLYLKILLKCVAKRFVLKVNQNLTKCFKQVKFTALMYFRSPEIY